MSGRLNKKSPKAVFGMRSWQSRYFALYEDRVIYKKDEQTSDDAGMMRLCRIVCLLRLGSPIKDAILCDWLAMQVKSGCSLLPTAACARRKVTVALTWYVVTDGSYCFETSICTWTWS
jgi:hypothetical protein